jgi:hypothetical protein
MVFDGQSNSFVLPSSFMNGAKAAILYAVVKSEKTENPIWSMGPSSQPWEYWRGTLYPNESGQIEDDFASTVTHVAYDPPVPLNQWHVYQVTSADGVWRSAINQTPLPKEQPIGQCIGWIFDSTGTGISIDYSTEVTAMQDSVPVILPDPAIFDGIDACIISDNTFTTTANDYFGLKYIGLQLEDRSWLEYHADPSELVVNKRRIPSGPGNFSLFYLPPDEAEALLGTSLHDKRITRIKFDLCSVVLKPDGTYAYSNLVSYFEVCFGYRSFLSESKGDYSFDTNVQSRIGEGFKGEIAEILIYDETSDPDESVNVYLSDKYGLFVADPLKDSDGDGIPDAWEIRRGLNPLDPSDAQKPADSNGAIWLLKYKQYLLQKEQEDWNKKFWNGLPKSLPPKLGNANPNLEIFTPAQ